MNRDTFAAKSMSGLREDVLQAAGRMGFVRHGMKSGTTKVSPFPRGARVRKRFALQLAQGGQRNQAVVYTIDVYTGETAVASKTAKLFVNGGSQAVRLPAEFRFDGSDEVYIRRDAVTGDVILSARPASKSWREFFALRDQALVPADFMNDRPLNEPLKPRESFEDR